MTKELEMIEIDTSDLANVTGGEGEAFTGKGKAAANRLSATGELSGSFAGFTVGGKGRVDLACTNYATCLHENRGSSVDDKLKACGLPPP